MTVAWHRLTNVSMGASSVLARRDFLRGIVATGTAALSWNELVASQAEALRQRGMACVLLFMRGGASQFETFSPKPDHANGGGTKAIDTSVPGIQISENLPQVAGVMKDFALVRSMTTKEGNHARAVSLMHTGYAPTASVKYPALGSIAAHEIGDPACELPAFVRIGGRGGGEGGGLLGAEMDPFTVATADAPPANTSIPTTQARFRRRLNLLERLEANYAARGQEQLVADHHKRYTQAADMISSAQMRAFDLEQESDRVRDSYGRTQFGSACLLARRLVESGVTFIEVDHNGWDTHDDNFNRTKSLCAQIDQPMAQLVRDLGSRGMLERTLVLWMGEFGRTPRVNPRGGRDHFPRAFTVALAGGGIRGGQCVGETDAGGEEISDRPVSVQDLFRTICQALSIDADKENMSAIGRPIRIVDGGEPVKELMG